MTEKSYWWSTGSTGDGASTYTRTDLSVITKIMGGATGVEGVVPGYLSVLAAMMQAANTLRVASGAAIVDGKPYLNDANNDITIPSAATGGNTRIDRIVLRANWTGQTVRLTRIGGTEAVNPTAPSITQISGTTYDILLYQVKVDTSGNLTITDERTIASNEFALVYVIGDRSDEIVTGLQGVIELPFSGLIKQATIVADVSGSCVVDIWKDTYANFPPTDADSICGATPLTLSSTQKYQDTTLTGWTKSFAAGEWLAFNVDSAVTVKQVTISLRGYKL